MELINIILGENDDFLRGREALCAPFDKQKQITNIVPNRFKADVEALTNHISEASFKRGLCIDVLSELIDVIPRKRRRKEAYNSLIKYLKDEQNITITIKTKNNERIKRD
ncbi:MAG: hypothetical protein K2G15_04450 [Muribaculaceae bacterium]|nr:hypothetical protein [Muribaculaceae bacterium]